MLIPISEIPLHSSRTEGEVGRIDGLPFLNRIKTPTQFETHATERVLTAGFQDMRRYIPDNNHTKKK